MKGEKKRGRAQGLQRARSHPVHSVHPAFMYRDTFIKSSETEQWCGVITSPWNNELCEEKDFTIHVQRDK